MKIICIGRNYKEHAKELNNDLPNEPLFFLKPDTASLAKRMPFFIPDFTNDVHHEVEVVVKIDRVGKNIEEHFAHKYYSEISLGIDFTARDVQRECKKNAWPWEKAKSFDGSAPTGKFIDKGSCDLDNLSFQLYKNDQLVQQGNTKDMIFNINTIISYVSKFITLKRGDFIFTGTPSGVSRVEKGDSLKGYIGKEEILKVQVR